MGGFGAGETMPKSEILIYFLEQFSVNLNWLFSGIGEPYLDSHDHKIVNH